MAEIALKRKALDVPTPDGARPTKYMRRGEIERLKEEQERREKEQKEEQRRFNEKKKRAQATLPPGTKVRFTRVSYQFFGRIARSTDGFGSLS